MSDGSENDRSVESKTTGPLSLEYDLPETPQKVWKALTEPEIVARWIVPGHDDDRAAGRPDYGLLDVEPGRRVSYRWREGSGLDSVVTFSIATNAVGGTRLTIVHSDMRGAPVAMSGSLACRFVVGGRRPAPTASNLNWALARAA